MINEDKKLKLNIISYKESTLLDLAKNNNLKGSGVENDPIEIESSEIFPQDFEIHHSKLFIKFRNCGFKSVKLRKCSNLIFEMSEIGYLNVRNTAEILIKSCTLESLSLTRSVHVDISDSEIAWFRLTESFLNSIKGGSIKNITKVRSSDNEIEVEGIPEEEKQKGERFPTSILSLIINFSIFFTALSIILFSFMLNFFDFAVMLFASLILVSEVFGVIFVIVSLVSLTKRVEKYYEEKQIIFPNLKKQIVGGLLILSSIGLVDVLFMVDLTFYYLWANEGLRIVIILASIILCSTSSCLGINLLSKANPFNRRDFRERLTPLYPFFIPVVTFLVPFLIILAIGILIGALTNMLLMINVILIVIAVLFLTTSILTRVKLKKLMKTSAIISSAKYRVAFSSSYVSVGMLLIILIFQIAEGSLFSDLQRFSLMVVPFALGGYFILQGFESIIPKSSQKLSAASYSYSRGKYEKSTARYQKLLARDPDNVLLLNNLGATYIATKQYDKALELFRRAIEINPNYKPAWNSLGVAYLHLKEYGNAKEALEKALKAPQRLKVSSNVSEIFLQLSGFGVIDDRILLNLSRTYNEMGNLAKAIETCKKGININPKNKELWDQLGNYYLENDEFDRCINDFEEAIKRNLKFDNILTILGYAYYKKQDYERSIELLQKALDVNVKYYLASFGLAKAYFTLAQYKKALKACKLSLRFKPDNDEAIALLKEIYKAMEK